MGWVNLSGDIRLKLVLKIEKDLLIRSKKHYITCIHILNRIHIKISSSFFPFPFNFFLSFYHIIPSNKLFCGLKQLKIIIICLGRAAL